MSGEKTDQALRAAIMVARSLGGTDRLLAAAIRGALQNDLTWVARSLVGLVRRGSQDVLAGRQSERAPNPAAPAGPFRFTDPDRRCALLLFVPRSLESLLIDHATAGYGYSHVAVDVGEEDVATGQRVMTEATPRAGVHRSYLTKYGSRGFVRIPLEPAGVDAAAFRHCIQDKLGEPYNVAEALTWGQVHDPARQICSDLAANCLPAQLRLAIAALARAGGLGPHAVSTHGSAGRPLYIFISPNAFARFFGAPRGYKVKRPDQLVFARGPGLHGRRVCRLAAGALLSFSVAVGLWIAWRRLGPDVLTVLGERFRARVTTESSRRARILPGGLSWPKPDEVLSSAISPVRHQKQPRPVPPSK